MSKKIDPIEEAKALKNIEVLVKLLLERLKGVEEEQNPIGWYRKQLVAIQEEDYFKEEELCWIDYMQVVDSILHQAYHPEAG